MPLRRLFWFFIVGGVATGVHLASVVLLVRWGGWHPIPANAVAWLVAFVCSFLGHHRMTFAQRRADPSVAARRFLLVSAGAFAANQLAYAAVVSFTPIRYDVAVLLVSFAVALGTYVLSSRWAFRRPAA